MRTPKAGVLPCDSDLNAEVVFRRGEMSKNPRKGESRVVRFSLNEGFSVLREKIMRFLRQEPFSSTGARLIDEKIYFRSGKSTPQSKYKPIDECTFEAMVRSRWSKITAGDVIELLGDEPDEPDHEDVGRRVSRLFSFQFYLYLSAPVSATATSLRRATASRIADATVAVVEFSRHHSHLGPIATTHLITTHARQPEGTPVMLSDDNTSRQARQLDDAIRAAEEDAPTTNPETAEIEIRIGGSWVRLPVRISSLRAALNLPQHDIFSRGIFHGFNPVAVSQPTGPDVPDEDHMSDDSDILV